MAVEKPCSMPGRPLFCFDAQTSLENTAFALWGSILGSFQSRAALSGQSPLPIEHSLMSGCGQGHEVLKDMWNMLWLNLPGLIKICVTNNSRKYKSRVKLSSTHVECNSETLSDQ